MDLTLFCKRRKTQAPITVCTIPTERRQQGHSLELSGPLRVGDSARASVTHVCDYYCHPRGFSLFPLAHHTQKSKSTRGSTRLSDQGHEHLFHTRNALGSCHQRHTKAGKLRHSEVEIQSCHSWVTQNQDTNQPPESSTPTL